MFYFLDTHALVQFIDEDATAIVPITRLKEQDQLEYGGSYVVTWSNKKAYKAMLICSGLHILEWYTSVSPHEATKYNKFSICDCQKPA